MTHRVLKVLPVILSLMALVVIVGGLTILRAAMSPLVRVSGYSPATEARQSPVTAAEARAQKEIEARYLELQQTLEKADATELGRILTADFTMDRLFGDRVYRYTAQFWKASLQRSGPRQNWPVWMDNDGMRVQQRKKSNVEVGRIALNGDEAEVVATIKDTYSYSRVPAEAVFDVTRQVTERDVWRKVGPKWRLKHIQMLTTKVTRESSLQK